MSDFIPVVFLSMLPPAIDLYIFKLLLLAFTAGVLVTGLVEEIVPEAHQEGEARAAAFMFVAGFALFTLFSMYLG